jgi:S-adenosylmethionine:tRNA ribosyltransferase-isomerase
MDPNPTASAAAALPAAYDLAQYDFVLPPELIARTPLPERSASRMLVVDPANDRIQDYRVRDLPGFLQAGDVLVRNNTRVLKARLQARKRSGGAAELLIERLLGAHLALAQIGVSKKPKPGDDLQLADGQAVRVLAREGQFWQLQATQPWLDIMQALGSLPLPHYMQRDAGLLDDTRYQTVYAEQAGSVAAPTAGLHFDAALLQMISARGVDCVDLTLHVGAGTFSPIRVSDIRGHSMHRESIAIPSATQRAVLQAKASGARICAVGTTSLRSLESWALQVKFAERAAASQPASQPADFVSSTELFIYPGFHFQLSDCLLTNFHLPKSSLFILVSALAGRALMQRAYQHAIAERYRFYSYGDAMLIAPGALR